MDFANLNSEQEVLQNSVKSGLTNLIDLNNFFKSLVKYGETLHNNCRTTSEKLFNELMKTETKTSLNKQIINFYRGYETYNSKYKTILKRIEGDIIDPSNVFEKHLQENFKNSLEKFKSLINQINLRKSLVDKAKKTYFDSCRQVQEKEKIFMKQQELFANNIDINNNPSLSQKFNQIHDNLVELKVQAENQCHLYKEEITKANSDFCKFEEKYYECINEIKKFKLRNF